MNEEKKETQKAAYTAYDDMRKKFSGLCERYGFDAPVQPQVLEQYRIWNTNDKGQKGSEPTLIKVSELETMAVKFIRERCKKLRFRPDKNDIEDSEGTSLKPGQVPYNFQMDTDRRCLEVALHRFLESGMAKEAFDVYFCYLEMFIGSYGKTKKMIEMLSEFETNASSLLMKHRDHYSHSVYVFAIGLAYYESSENIREAYKNAYNLSGKNEHEVAAHFLKYWGLTALFHDIGYPFELAFEQVKSYFGDTIEYVPFVKFNMNNYQHSKYTVIKNKLEKIKKDHPDNSKDKSQKISDIENINSFIEIVFADNDNEKNKLLKKIPKNADTLPDSELDQKYNEAINCLDEIIDEAGKKRDMLVSKLIALSPAGYKSSEVEDLNVFLANALYAELGEKYAYYNDNIRKFDKYEKFCQNSDDRNKCSYLDYLKYVLCSKPEKPDEFGGFIDHAYFSSIMLLSSLLDVLDINECIECGEMYTHSLTAILLHNSLYKFSITNYKNSEFNNGKQFKPDINPLAYLLMLCDELQCWDRMAYGRSSRKEIHPYDCELSFKKDKITATYLFDSNTYAKKKDKGEYELKKEYADKKVKGSYHTLIVEEGKTKCKFLEEIENIISLNNSSSFVSLSTSQKLSPNKRYRSSSLSTSSFIHLYKFAVLVHQMNHLEKDETLDDKKWAEYEKKFEEMSLEYKINHISRAKKFARILQEVGCFYSDKPMDCELVTEFNEKEDLEEIMGPMEHERWSWEHWLMGWKSIDKMKFEELKSEFRKANPENTLNIRECLKLHPDMPPLTSYYDKQIGIAHYFMLDIDKPGDNSTKEKDKKSMRNLLDILSKEDGIKVYRLEK